MACKIIYKGKALPEEEAKIEINNDVVDDLNEQAVGKSIINSALLTDEEINQQITDLNKFKTVIENNYFKLEDNISVSSLVINKHIKNAPASLGKVKIDSKWRTKEEAKKQVEENLKQRKLFSKLKRNFGITEEQLNLIENVSADKAISSAEDLINAIESKLLSLNSLVLNSKKSKSATLQQKEQAKTIEQLFNENPKLANEVYEALGYNSNLPIIANKEIEFLLHKEKLKINLQDITLEEEGEIDLNLKNKWNTFAIKAQGKKLGYVQVKYKDDNTVQIGLSALYEGKEEVKKSIISKILDLIKNLFKTKKVEDSGKKINVNAGKGVGKVAYELLAVKLKRDYQKDLISDTTRSDYAENLWKSFEKQGKASVIGKTDTQYRWDYYYKFNVVNQITPEQKQQAQQFYSQYLDSLNKPNTNPILQGNQKPDVILPIGTSGSGKSTFIKSLPQENLVVIEPDAMRVEFTGDMNDKSKDKEIYEEAAKRAVAAIKQGKQVVFDTTNLTKDKRLPFIEAIKKEIPNANIQYKLMELNPELAKQRIKADIAAGKNRANVPDATIDRHAESYKQMLEDIKDEPISNFDVQQEQVKKFAELQERLNNEEFLEGAKFAFESSEELKSFGTQEEYNDYIARVSLGIVKNPTSGDYNYTSQVKDIVYRGDTGLQTNLKSKELGIFFTDDKNAANIYAVKYKGDEFDDSIIQTIVNKFGLNPTIEQIKSEIAFFENMGATKEQIEKEAKEFQNYILKNKGMTQQAILNIKNPKNLTVKDWFDNYDNSSNLKENSDGLLLKGGKQSNNRIYDAGENQIVVFEPEQIHILSSQADIQGFKDFVQGKQFQKLTAEEKAKAIEQITKEHRSIVALKDLAAKLAYRIGGKVEFVNRTDVDWKGYNKGMTSVLNEAYMDESTTFHEILAHPIIKVLKKSKPEIYQSLLKELETSETGRKVFEQVKRDYVNKEFKDFDDIVDISKDFKIVPDAGDTDKGKYYLTNDDGENFGNYNLEEIVNKFPEYFKPTAYTLEEQQEEAIVTLLGMLAADKLDKIKDKNLISLLKELLLQMSEYIKSLFTAKEIRISELNVSNLEFLTNKKIEDLIKSDKIKKEC